MKNALLSVLLLTASIVANAAPVTYTFSGTATGSLGGAGFSSAEFVVSLEWLTEGITIFSGSQPGLPIYQNLVPTPFLGSATIDIAGIGATSFTQSMLMVAQTGDYYACSNCVAITNALAPAEAFPFVASNDAFIGYDLSTSISASWASPTHVGAASVALNTVAGDLLIDYSETTSFMATVVPIPAAVWLFGSALAGLGWMRSR